ncbi:hypothetical protein EB796_013033 [Bugula neritina]|uniref:Protein kinase domain-containing protein n=1 Tax=Bugula neritina TaxID=10212 RepID=A0A7J7JRX4_BUGNE|nr:hypothetical protein EB796_013033 [Bugula neritina]
MLITIVLSMSRSKNFDKLLQFINEGNAVGFEQKLISLTASQRLDVLKKQDDEHFSLFEYAAIGGHTEIVKVAIALVPASEHYNILAIQGINECTTLHVAAYFGRTDIVELIASLLLRADLYRLLRIQDKQGNTSLTCGLMEKKTETVKFILNCLPAADMCKVISIPNNRGNTVLSWAAQCGLMDLLKLCVDIIPPEQLYSQLLVADDDGDTVIHFAAYRNQSEAAVYLLNKLTAIQVGEIVEIQNKEGHNPIEYAKSKGYHKFVTVVGVYLRDRKIFLNGKVKHVVVGEKLGSGGQATVYRGTWLSTPVAIKILPNPFGIDLSETPLQEVEEYNAIKNLRHPNIIQFFGVGQLRTDIGLVMELCDTDLKKMSQQIEQSGEALFINEGNAVGFEQKLRSLTASQRLDVLKKQDDEHFSLFEYAAIGGHTEIVKVAIALVPASEHYNILAIQGINECTTLHVAAYFGRTDIVELIASLLLRADLYRLLRIQDKQGNTPLTCGLREKKTETVKFILNCLPAADMCKVTSIPNNRRNTVLSWAAQCGLMDLLKLCVDIIPPEQLYSQLLVAGDDGGTVIHCAACGNQSEAAVYLLDKLTAIQVGEKLGSGGQATVYRGTWLSTPVAIKILPNPFGIDLSKTSLPELEEYNAIKNLRHPNVIQFFGVGQLKTDIGLVMELCDTDLKIMSQQIGQSGDALMKLCSTFRIGFNNYHKIVHHDKMPEGKLLRIIKDSLCGLVYLHDKNMIHMDVKPHNILGLQCTELQSYYTDMLQPRQLTCGLWV